MKKNEQKKHGFVLTLLFALCYKISAVFHSGTTFKLLSSCKDDESAFDSSALCRGIGHLKKRFRRASESVKKFSARQFERSFMLRMFSAGITKLVNIPGRVLGAFGLTWGAYVILIDLIKRFALFIDVEGNADILVGVVAFISSIPLLFTDKSVSAMAKESWLVSSILTNVFGIPDESFKNVRKKKSTQSGAVILGILLGLITYFISPLHMIAGALIFVVFVLILSYPEGGVLISVALSPLLGLFEHSSVVLAFFVLLTAVSYFFKVLRGKRVFKVSVTGLAVYAFIGVIFISGFAPGGANTMQNALLCCSLMLIFPLIVNLMKSRRWLTACVVAFALPSAVVAVIGFVQYMLGIAPSGWIDQSLYSEITQRAVSVFNNPNILGVYLAAMLPISLMLTTSRFEKKIRVLGYMSSLYIIVCVIFTYSRSAWLGLLCGAVLFAMMISPKGILWLIPAGIVTVALALIFPDTIGARLLNFVSVSDSANNYRLDVWNSSWNLLSDTWLFGIGWGEEAFRTAYINYGTDGTQYAMHSHSLYMQIAIQTGLCGIIVFILSIGSIFRNYFSVFGKSDSKDVLALYSGSALSGAFAVLITGIFDYTWYNFRVFFIFWALLAFAFASANVEQNEKYEWSAASEENYSYVTVSIPSANDTNSENR